MLTIMKRNQENWKEKRNKNVKMMKFRIRHYNGNVKNKKEKIGNE